MASSLVVVAALAVGAAQWRRQADVHSTGVGLTHQLSALRLGELRPAGGASATAGPQRDAQGRRLVTLWLSVRNTGEHPAHVSADALSGDYTQLTKSHDANIDAGASAVLTLSAAVDCTAVPEPSQADLDAPPPNAPLSAQESWVQLRVTADREPGAASRAWRYDTLAIPAFSVPGALSRACSNP